MFYASVSYFCIQATSIVSSQTSVLYRLFIQHRKPSPARCKSMHGFYTHGSVIVLCYSLSLLDWPPTLDMPPSWPLTFPGMPPFFLDEPPSLLSWSSSPLNRHLSSPSPLNRPLSLLGRPQSFLHRHSPLLGRTLPPLSMSSSFLDQQPSWPLAFLKWLTDIRILPQLSIIWVPIQSHFRHQLSHVSN